jgi:hypothetical protein
MKFSSENHSGDVNIDSGPGGFLHPFQPGIHIHIASESIFTSLRNDYSHAPESALTSPDVDLGTNGYVPLVMESKQQVLAAYNEMADKLITFIENTSDDTFEQNCDLLWEGHIIYSGTRYNAYRSLGLNHLLHHRAQLGVYLRLLDVPVPATPYGPSADEQ